MLTCGSAVLSCLCSESLSWLTSCSLPCVRPRFSWDSLRVSRRRSLSSSMDTIRDSKWPSESDCKGEPEPRPPPPPPPGPSDSLIVGITSHIIYTHAGCRNKTGGPQAMEREAGEGEEKNKRGRDKFHCQHVTQMCNFLTI